MYQKTMFDRYYCIKSFCHLKTLEKCFENVPFLYYYNGAQKHEELVGFENACSRAKTCHPYVTKLSSCLCALLLMRSIFVMAYVVPRCSLIKFCPGLAVPK